MYKRFSSKKNFMSKIKISQITPIRYQSTTYLVAALFQQCARPEFVFVYMYLLYIVTKHDFC
jgi:hypothetical protein